MGNVRLKDVAEMAGVSTATVSRVINGKKTVNPHLREKVLRAINELEYNPNHMARVLKQNASQILGLILPHISNSFFAVIAETVEETAKEYGYMTILSNTFWEEQSERECFRRMKQIQADGMVLLPSSAESVRNCPKIPLVIIDKFVDGFTCVGTDNRRGIALAVEHLVDLGHRRIALLGNIKDRNKYMGYVDALHSHFIEYDDSIVINTTDERWQKEDDVYAELYKKCQGSNPVTAVVCFSDNRAIRLMRFLSKRGMSIPRDIAVVGYDDTNLAEILDLTSVSQPAREIGRIAAEKLFNMISGKSSEIRKITLCPRLVVRGSTRLLI